MKKSETQKSNKGRRTVCLSPAVNCGQNRSLGRWRESVAIICTKVNMIKEPQGTTLLQIFTLDSNWFFSQFGIRFHAQIYIYDGTFTPLSDADFSQIISLSFSMPNCIWRETEQFCNRQRERAPCWEAAGLLLQSCCAEKADV